MLGFIARASLCGCFMVLACSYVATLAFWVVTLVWYRSPELNSLPSGLCLQTHAVWYSEPFSVCDWYFQGVWLECCYVVFKRSLGGSQGIAM